MGSRSWSVLLACAVVGALALAPAPRAFVRAASSAPAVRALAGQTPDTVVHGGARPRGPHDARALLTLNIGLGVHNSAALDALIAAANTPGNPQYGHYLSPARYAATFAPTTQEVDAVRAWTARAGLTVRSVAPNNLLVTVQGSTSTVERALGVGINDYTVPGRGFYANDRDATVPSGLDIRAISGLSTLRRFHIMRPISRHSARTRGNSFESACALDSNGQTQPCYYPRDFQAAYNMGSVGDASNQTIGLTLWGPPVAQSDLDAFAAHTGTQRIVVNGAGANGVEFIQPDGPVTDTSTLDEEAMDVEYAHGVAPNSHLKYWLGNIDPTRCDASGCQPTDQGLEDAVNAAATDTSLHVVSNSWGGSEATSAADPFVSNINASLQYAASHGTTFYFPSGDQGAWSGSTDTTQAPGFPADSPYVVAVGGTNLQTGASGSAYGSESTWSCADYTACTAVFGTGGSGGGCSTIFARPSWQTGVGAATCSGRAEPDVSADGDPNSGAYVYVAGQAETLGGTSLAAPLWAGMAADLNRYLGDAGRPLMGFAAPRIYQLATDPTTGARDFHDVTSGGAGYPAGTGWDQATGWGSPNLANLAADWAGGSVSTTATPSASSTSSPTTTATPSNTTTPTDTPTTTPTATPTNTPTSTASPTNTATTPPAATGGLRTSPATAPPTRTATPTSAHTPHASPTPTTTRRHTNTYSRPAALGVVVGALPHIIRSRSTIIVGVVAAPRERVAITILLARTTVTRGRARSGKTIDRRRTIVLFQSKAQITADKHGRGAAHVRLGGHSFSAGPATLTVTVQAMRRTLIRRLTVVVGAEPRRRHRPR